MKRSEFFEAAHELSRWINALSLATQSALREAEDLLCRKQEPLGNVPPRGVLNLVVRGLGSKIEEVMAAYDRMREAVDLDPRFEQYFQFVDAPEAVQSEVRQILWSTQLPRPDPSATPDVEPTLNPNPPFLGV